MARSSSRPTNTYRSRVDIWIPAVMALSLLAAIAGIFVGGMQEGPLRVAQGGFIVLGVAGFLAWILLGTTYTLEGRELIVRSGPMRWKIAIDDIHSIEPARGLKKGRSSPALSMDRLLITYGSDKSLMISPDERERFLADIKARQ